MKNLLKSIFLLLLISSPYLYAQITLEAAYKDEVDLIQVDLGVFKYVRFNSKSIDVYNLDHSLYKTVNPNLPIDVTILESRPNQFEQEYISYKSSSKLFNDDNKLEFIFQVLQGRYGMNHYVVNENGEVLLLKKDVRYYLFRPAPNGTKLIFVCGNNNSSVDSTYIYSLPGKLITSENNNLLPNDKKSGEAMLYPSPTNGKSISLKYTLPANSNNADLELVDLQGKKLQVFKVTDLFSDLLLDITNFKNGMYFYRLKGEGWQTPLEKFIVSN